MESEAIGVLRMYRPSFSGWAGVQEGLGSVKFMLAILWNTFCSYKGSCQDVRGNARFYICIDEGFQCLKISSEDLFLCKH